MSLKRYFGLILVSCLLPIIPISALSQDQCSKELLLAYFPEVFVNEALARYNVPKSNWDAINRDLSAQGDEVIRMVEEKASQISPNPLKDPSQRQVAVKIFRETLLQVFSGVMNAHGVTDSQQIKEMLDFIQQQKAERFAECLKIQREQSSTQQEDTKKGPKP